MATTREIDRLVAKAERKGLLVEDRTDVVVKDWGTYTYRVLNITNRGTGAGIFNEGSISAQWMIGKFGQHKLISAWDYPSCSRSEDISKPRSFTSSLDGRRLAIPAMQRISNAIEHLFTPEQTCTKEEV